MSVPASSALFIALEVENSAARNLLGLQSGVSDAHWVPRAALHVTMRYLRVIERQDELIERLNSVTRATFKMKVAGVGHFDLLDGAVALWAGVKPVRAMCDLHEALDNIALDMGSQRPSRPWKPHISVGFRARPHASVTTWKQQHKTLDLPSENVTGFGLFSSRKLPETGGYERIAWFPLSLEARNDVPELHLSKEGTLQSDVEPVKQAGDTS
ncbi:hypothetical protein GCM10007385_42980 [Tateyamaria omphalii]|uniref:RNA 2',3'-cyclic phosphodiesterase n=1 Tax=Tateyamaria omphalii TaxID=299262 RepID=UPI001672E91C|nr:RNA 2',3'-cyclic phosphodiesterase [Tateyamaria omphalii]GGX69232.1 hypothetical protein GCM10007385_42980 [Tateyamaria omphalii]